jgi:hypothetical protein
MEGEHDSHFDANSSLQRNSCLTGALALVGQRGLELPKQNRR